MVKKVLSILLQLPAYLLLVGSVIAGFYAWAKGINDIGLGVPIILFVVLVLFIMGKFLENRLTSNEIMQEQANPQGRVRL